MDAIDALVRLRARQAVPHLENMAQTEGDEQLRKAARRAIEKLGE
jgi:HEAT repeat protein